MQEAPFFCARDEIDAAGYGLIDVDCRSCAKAVIHLDLAKVVRDPNWYPRDPAVRSYRHDLPFNGDEQRIRSLIRLLQSTHRLGPASVFLGVDGAVCYPDGRHRVMLLHAAGYRSLPAEVPPEQAQAIAKVIGCETPDPRIRVRLPKLRQQPQIPA
jgi:hypothetical protein